MEAPSVQQFIGKTLKDVRAMQAPAPVRVIKAGNIGFRGTCDYKPQRLNVELGEEGLKFYNETVQIGDQQISIPKVDGSMDLGIVVAAHWG